MFIGMLTVRFIAKVLDVYYRFYDILKDIIFFKERKESPAGYFPVKLAVNLKPAKPFRKKKRYSRAKQSWFTLSWHKHKKNKHKLLDVYLLS